MVTLNRKLLSDVLDALDNLVTYSECDCEEHEHGACDVCRGRKALDRLIELMEKEGGEQW